MITVFVNGILQLPGVDYVIGASAIQFQQAPQAGSSVEIRTAKSTIARVLGDGSTFLFPIMVDADKYNEITDMLHQALKYYQVPAVAEALEKLRVVVELVRE